MKSRILLIEDSTPCLILEREALKSLGEIDEAKSLSQARNHLDKAHYQLIILDLSLPDGDGMSLLSDLQSHADAAMPPVILVSGTTEPHTKVSAFHFGAADYVEKPFNQLELRARAERLLKADQSHHLLQFADLRIFPERLEAEVMAGGEWKRVELTVREFKILVTLAKSPGLVLSRNQIIERVWGLNISVSERTVDTHISTLRKKLGTCEVKIEAIRQAGYKLSSP